MEYGSYRRNRVDFRPYRVSRFHPYLFDIDKHPYETCGSAVLSLLTGESPAKVEKFLPRGQIDWTDNSIAAYLRKRKYEVIKVTKCDVTDNPVVIEYPIRDEHVIILSKLCCRDEGTWTVVHNGIEYHNFQASKLSVLEYVNNPIMSAHVVYHRRWR